MFSFSKNSEANRLECQLFDNKTDEFSIEQIMIKEKMLEQTN
jgi:hypothetical protein